MRSTELQRRLLEAHRRHAAAPGVEVKQPDKPSLLSIMGPGLITGASDDDPSGIATYSQAGAQFGFS